MRQATFISILASLALLALGAPPSARASAAADLGHRSVVKIYVTNQRENYALPWQGGPQASGSGTGFIISGRRILTNAHLIADARFLEVQKDGDARRFRARVRFVAHDCDLAMLEIEDPSFFENTRAMRLANDLPTLNDEVIVLGYPLGGDRLSVTKGVVSRLEYAAYAHSGVDQHLVLQVDAAINPGNSGGPVLLHSRVVGLAFQGLAWAENIGYAIPLPVIKRFLADVADGQYHGYPELGVSYIDLQNPALRADLAMPSNRSGVAIYFVDDFGAAQGHLQPRDVILAIDGHTLADDGTITIGRDSYLFSELLERKQWGDTISLMLWRDGKELAVDLPLDNASDPFTYRNLYDRRSPYVVIGGLVFTPLTQEYLRTLPRGSAAANIQELFYTVEHVKTDRLHVGRREFVVLIERLPHAVNTYLGDYMNGIVDTVNDQPIPDLRALHAALAQPVGRFHRIRFVGSEDVLVLDAEQARLAEADILRTYNVPAPLYLEATP